MINEKKIYLGYRDRKEIKKAQGVSDSLMSNALGFKSNSEAALRVRNAAMNFFRGILF